jgi:hypothetical protein
MELHDFDTTEAYIDSKVERLQKERSHGIVRSGFLWVTALVLWALGYVSGGEAFLIMVVGTAWASISYALCNIHVDILGTLYRDIQRDREAEYEHSKMTASDTSGVGSAV